MKQNTRKQTRAARAARIFTLMVVMFAAGNAGKVTKCRTENTVTVEVTK